MATVLGSPPEGNYASVEKYYELICPQIIDILNNQVNINYIYNDFNFVFLDWVMIITFFKFLLAT